LISSGRQSEARERELVVGGCERTDFKQQGFWLWAQV